MRILTWLAAIVLAWCGAPQGRAQVTMPDGSVIARDRIDSAAAACQAGKADACLVRGIALERGIGEPIEINLAAAAFRSACEGGLGMGCEKEADIAARRHDRRKDLKLAAERWTRARTIFTSGCDSGNPLACHRLAAMLTSNSAMIDKPRAVTLLAKACFELKYGPSCIEGSALTGLSTSTAHDPALAARFEAAVDPALTSACDEERVGACAMLGEWLLARLGPKDTARIAALADKACSGGAVHGCALSADLVRRTDSSAEGWDRRYEFLDRACAIQFGYCSGLADLMRAAPPIRSIDSGLLFLADIKACLAEAEEHCWRLYEPAARLSSTELAQLVETFDQACLNLPRPSAEICASAASNHLERAEAVPGSAATDRATAARLYQRALELPEDNEENPTAHNEARAFLAGN
jgi:TPR repeat protein